MINEVNLYSVEKLLIMDLFLKNPTATRRSYACAISLPTAVLLFIILKISIGAEIISLKVCFLR